MNATDTRFVAGIAGTIILSVGGFILRAAYKRFKRSGGKEIESFSRYAAQGVGYYVGSFVRRQLAAQLTLRQYARLVLRSTGREMLVPATYPVHLRTDKAFIPLLLRGSVQEQISYDNFLDGHGRRIMVLGEPGSGKSSLFKRLFRDACRYAASSPSQHQVPILFELRNLPKENAGDRRLTGKELFDILVSPLEESRIYRASHAVDDLSSGAGFFVLLDGLDEVSSAQVSVALEALTKLSVFLAETSPRSTVLISSRTQYFFSIERRDLEEIFEVYTVSPFSLGDIYQFLTKWPFRSDGRANITRLFSRLMQLPSLTEMCTNPLALSMYVARDQQTGGSELPETRSRFYNSLMDELIVHRRFRHESAATGIQRLRDTRREILGSVCLEHLLSKDETPNALPVDRFVRAIKLKNYGGSDPLATLEQLANDTGLFAWERKGETMRFLHLTLCEFLAAAEVVERGNQSWEKLLSVLRSDTAPQPGERGEFWEARLSEVVAFAAGLAPRALRECILKDLTELKNSYLTFKAIIETQAYENPTIIDAIQSEVTTLLGSNPSDWDSEWFVRLRVIITMLRDAAAESSRRTSALPDSSQVLLELIERHHAEDRLLSTLARQDAESAISIAEKTGRRELMEQVVTAADDFVVLQGILSRCESGVKSWTAALVERALIDQNIANLLNSSSLEGRDADKSNVAPQRSWTRSWITRNSMYGKLLDSMLGDPGSWSDYSAPLLAQMTQLRPSKSEVYSVLRPALGLSLATVAPVFLLNYFLSFIWPQFRVEFNELTLPLFLALSAGYLLLRTGLTVVRTRRALINDFSVQVAGVTIRLTSRGRIDNEQGSSRELLEGRASDFRRYRVLKEILNIGKSRFRQMDADDFTNENIGIRLRLNAIIVGINLSDIRTLRLARSMRHDRSDKPADSTG